MTDYTLTDDVLGGRFTAGDSALHKLHPTIKIWVGLLLIIAVAFSSFQLLSILLVIIISCLKFAGLPFVHLIRGLRQFVFFFLVLALFPAFFSDGLLFQFSLDGLISGCASVLRFITIVLISMLLTRTIHPKDIVNSMKKMTPKKILGNGLIYDFFKVGLMSMQVIPYLFGEVERFAAANRQEWSQYKGIKKLSKLMGLVLPFLIHIFKSKNETEELIKSGPNI